MADIKILPKMDLISEKWVKPSSPTPPSSKNYKLSFFDGGFMNKPAPMAFFYPKRSFHGERPLCMELLETSLAKLLCYYYPFAGRLAEDKISINCNDEGVHLWEFQIHASMSEILDSPTNDTSVKNMVFPRAMYDFSCNSTRVMIQVNHFTCGGICIAVCISHELGDAQTLYNFVNDWASIACASRNTNHTLSPTPIFLGTCIFPPPSDHSSLEETRSNSLIVKRATTITRGFVLNASSISKLKKLVIDDSQIVNPTKVEVVTALIFMSAISASRRISGSFQPSALVNAVNFRALTRPPFSNQHVGNLVCGFVTNATEEREMNLSSLVTKLRKSKLVVQEAFKNATTKGNELFKVVLRFWEEALKTLNNNNLETYVFTSLCNLPLYEVDFGWGKPIHAFSCVFVMLENGFVLTDTPNGDGIEVHVTMKQDHMSLFQQDQHLLSFANLNPNIYTPNYLHHCGIPSKL